MSTPKMDKQRQVMSSERARQIVDEVFSIPGARKVVPGGDHELALDLNLKHGGAMKCPELIRALEQEVKFSLQVERLRVATTCSGSSVYTGIH